MRILTLFPPLVASCLRGPHLAPPLLTALLNQDKDLSAAYLDLNIRAIRSLLSDAFPVVSERIREGCGDSYTRSLLQKVDALTASQRIHSQLELIRVYLSLAAEYFLGKTNSLQKNLEILSNERAGSEGAGFYQNILLENRAVGQAEVFLLSVAFAEQLEAALVFARTLKQQGAGAVFLGGSQITLLEPEQLEQLNALGLFDKVCVGYYEADIVALIKQQASDATSEVYRAKAITRDSLHRLPRVAFNRDEIRMYFKPLELPVLATKGCYWGKCTFCDYAKMASYCQPAYLVRDAKHIFREIVALRIRYPKANIVLISDGISPALYLQLCRLAIKNRIKINTWSYMLHSDQLTDSFFETLGRAGVGFIDFGSESTCNRILALMRKPAQRDTIIDNFILAKKHGVASTMNVIIDFPSITYAECQQVINDMRFLMPYVSSFNPQLFHLSSNTPICDLSESLQITPESGYCDTGHGLQCREFTTASGMSAQEREDVVNTVGSLCLEQRLTHRISNVRTSFNTDERCLCYHDAGAFTFVREQQHYLAIPSLRSEVAITNVFSELINCILSAENPLHCTITTAESANYSFTAQEASIASVLMLELIKTGLVLYVKPFI